MFQAQRGRMNSILNSKNLVLSLLDFRLDHEAGFVPLMDAISGLTAEQASWQPTENSHSIWQIVNHVTFWNQWVLDRLQGIVHDAAYIRNDETFGNPGEAMNETSWREAVERVRAVCHKMRETVLQLDDSQLEQPYDDEGTPVKVVLADLALHDAYHIGQILYIRKMQGFSCKSSSM
jgi:uncharacterized damage-inducible protein DinB